MPSHKAHKIDLDAEYPCPACLRRKGRLVPITLTEAFGCDRCQQIFVVQEEGYLLEQLSTTYPYKRGWRWLGNRWVGANASLGENYLRNSLVVIFGVLLVGLCLVTISATLLEAYKSIIIIVFTMVCSLLLLLPAILQWLAYRR